MEMLQSGHSLTQISSMLQYIKVISYFAEEPPRVSKVLAAANVEQIF